MAGVTIPILINTVEEAKEKPSRTYRLDLEAGRIVGMVDGLEAVQQAIRKAIITPRFRCLIYDHQYGSEIQAAIIEKSASRSYIESATEGFIRDCLKPDTRVLSVSDFQFDFGEDYAEIKFTAETIYGEVKIVEVL